MEIDLNAIAELAEKTVKDMTPKMVLMSLSVVCIIATIDVERIVKEKNEEEILSTMQQMCMSLILHMKLEGFDLEKIEEDIRKEMNIDKFVQEKILDKIFEEALLRDNKGGIHEC